MIPIEEITDTQLDDICSSRIFRHDEFSYTILYETDKKELTKIYRHDKPRECYVIQEDIRTLYTLSRQSEKFAKRFILPDSILMYGMRIIGYKMHMVEGERLSEKIKKTNTKQATQWFSKIYNDILFLNSLNEPLAFSDLHEDNVLVDEKDELNYCDVDGFRAISGNGKYGRYLTMLSYLRRDLPDKYPTDVETGTFMSDKNSDIACLIVMIINYIMSCQYSFAELPADMAGQYLDFIDKKGMPSGIIEMVKTLYRKSDNYIELDGLYSMPDDLSIFSFAEFKKTFSKFKDEEEAILFIKKGFMRERI